MPAAVVLPDAAWVVQRTLRWYRGHGRDLPWRRPGTSPWAIVVSEFMLQQTPVSRVLEPWQAWVTHWPTPAALASVPAGDAVRAWGRLGYPRRALRLHQTATAIVRDHAGKVPADFAALRRLPGVGDYTAAAIGSFAFGQRHVVLDTNVRRVLSRIALGKDPAPLLTAAERQVAEAFLPMAPRQAARWAVASMELGALICTARAPRCSACPVAKFCRWRAGGQPAEPRPSRVRQPYVGTDRQCRGAILARLRAADTALTDTDLAETWPDREQWHRCLRSLLADGLAVRDDSGYRLP